MEYTIALVQGSGDSVDMPLSYIYIYMYISMYTSFC